jgi:hypothetical protein
MGALGGWFFCFFVLLASRCLYLRIADSLSFVLLPFSPLLIYSSSKKCTEMISFLSYVA